MTRKCFYLSLINFFIQEASGQDSSLCIPGQLLNSCQLFNTWKTASGNPILVTADNKYDTPLGTRICARKFNISYLRNNVEKNHPSGSELFPSNTVFAQQLNIFLSKIEKNTYFLVYFSRIHLVILHELYKYLTKIFTLFNMSHVENVSEYLINESTTALNKKTLIINHLLRLIESQSNQAIIARFPGLPQHLATTAGFTMMKHDYGADLDLLIDKQEDFLFTDSGPKQIIKDMRNEYLDIFGSYLAFFNAYTATLNQPDPFYGSTFMQHALTIEKKLSDSSFLSIEKNSKDQRVALLRSIKLINPPLFLYNSESLSAVRTISTLAKKIPTYAEKVPWPRKVVEDARNPQPIRDKNGIAITNQPAAYFLDSDGNRTTNSASARNLFVNIPTLQHMYSQEIVSQPTWLNSSSGIILMLRACLGDFAALLDPLFIDDNIFDPCIRCILTNAALKASLIEKNEIATKACTDCQDYLSFLRQQVSTDQQSESTLPDIGVAE